MDCSGGAGGDWRDAGLVWGGVFGASGGRGRDSVGEDDSRMGAGVAALGVSGWGGVGGGRNGAAGEQESAGRGCVDWFGDGGDYGVAVSAYFRLGSSYFEDGGDELCFRYFVFRGDDVVAGGESA